MRNNIINLIVFQGAWFITVSSAALGLVWPGPVYTASWLYVHLNYNRGTRLPDLGMVIIAAISGFTIDSMLVISGVFSFAEHAELGAPSTIWMTTLWMNLALTLNHSLAWLGERPLLGALFGAIAGPAAYFAGSQFGVIRFNNPGMSLLVLSLVWMLAVPALYACTRSLNSRHRQGSGLEAG